MYQQSVAWDTGRLLLIAGSYLATTAQSGGYIIPLSLLSDHVLL